MEKTVVHTGQQLPVLLREQGGSVAAPNMPRPKLYCEGMWSPYTLVVHLRNASATPHDVASSLWFLSLFRQANRKEPFPWKTSSCTSSRRTKSRYASSSCCAVDARLLFADSSRFSLSGCRLNCLVPSQVRTACHASVAPRCLCVLTSGAVHARSC